MSSDKTKFHDIDEPGSTYCYNLTGQESTEFLLLKGLLAKISDIQRRLRDDDRNRMGVNDIDLGETDRNDTRAYWI